MSWTSIFFNPTLRGNVLQLLLLSLTLPVNLAIASFSIGNTSLVSLILTIGAAFFILVHHVASLFLSRFSAVIIVDLLLLLFEIAGVSSTIFRISGLSLLALPTLIALIIMLSFRTATVLASPDRLWEQKLEFWGGCRATHRSPWMVLLNRPLGKPLVRGESIFAIVVRCVILVVIGISLPVLGVNKVFFQPSRASVYSRVIASQYSVGNPAIQLENTGNAVLIMPQSNAPTLMSVSTVNVSSSINCTTSPKTLSNLPGLAIENLFTVATCPVTWADIDRMNVSITFSPPGVPYGIYPGVGDLNDIVMFTQPIPVLAEFNLFAYMTWTSRQLVSTHSGFLSLFNAFLPGRNVQHMEVHSLLSAPGSGPITTTSTPSALDTLPDSTTTVTITIVQRESLATKFVQDYTDATALDGLASMGGLWTTIDAIFTLLFGASVLYFAFGKRPLSPLGIVHTFQHRTLTRNWHEDFPAVRTEGGEPGSDNAGVVAFLRDRWLDIAEEVDCDAPARDEKGEGTAAPWV